MLNKIIFIVIVIVTYVNINSDILLPIIITFIYSLHFLVLFVLSLHFLRLSELINQSINQSINYHNSFWTTIYQNACIFLRRRCTLYKETNLQKNGIYALQKNLYTHTVCNT